MWNLLRGVSAMASKKKKSVSKNYSRKDETMKRQLWAVFWLAAAVFICAGTRFTAQTGMMGRVVNVVFGTVFGEGTVALPFLLGAAAIGQLFSERIENLRNRFYGLAIIFCLFVVSLHLKLTFQHIEVIAGEGFYSSILGMVLQGQGGGLLGALLAVVMLFLFKDLGSYIVISALGVVALLLVTNSSLLEILPEMWSILKKAGRHLWIVFRDLVGVKNGLDKRHNLKETYTIKGYEAKEYEAEETVEESEKTTAAVLAGEKERKEPLLSREHFTGTENGDAGEGDQEASSTDLARIIEENRPFEDYKLPPVSILTRVGRLRDYQQQKVIQERARALEGTFESFGVKVKIKEIQTGPAVTRFEIQPETGVKVSKILSLSDDLALNLAASDVRIEAPIPGKAAVGIEVPNKIISLVYLREVLEDPLFLNSNSPLITGLGKDITGVPVFADLLKMPHLLIAGSTGSGKSVCINTIICSILLKATPWVVKFLFIDPKLVELSIYNGIPHLVSPVITEPKRASVVLRSMVKEMERRYDLFAQEGVRDISRYNEQVKGNGGDGLEQALPYIVVVIDELADLMMVAPSEVEDSIVRLSQMSRAAGIHLVIATQRPSVDIITGLIKANITSRIAFAVSSQADSRTILDMGGAEKLLGRGDMLYYPIGMHKPMRVQGAFVSERDIFNIVEFIKQQESPVYQQSFFSEEMGDDLSVEEDKESDPLLADVVELIIQTGCASISLIQRRFRVGYTRAARLIDELERIGIVGPYEGSKPRPLLMNSEQAAAVLKEKLRRN